MLMQAFGKLTRHSMGIAVYSPPVVTYITPEWTGSTTWPYKRRISGRTSNGRQRDLCKADWFISGGNLGLI